MTTGLPTGRVVAFLPFPTRLITDALSTGEGQNVAVTIYGMTLLAIHVLGSALSAYARHAHLYAPPAEDQEAKSTHRRPLPVFVGYAIAILVGVVVPAAAVAVYFGLAVYLIVPLHQITRVVFRRSSG